MATITVTVGPVTATVSASNANALALISDYLEASGGPTNGTNQEKLDFWLRAVVRSTRLFANDFRRQKLAEQAALDAGLDSRDWV